MNNFLKISDQPSIGIASPKLIGNRLDADYYRITFVENEEVLYESNIPIEMLGNMWIEANYGSLPDSVDYSEDGIFLIRGTDISGYGIAPENELIRVPASYYHKFKKAQVFPGYLLILVKGASIDREDSNAIIPASFAEHAIINGSVFKVKLKPELNNYYVAAFMFSRHFLLQKRRSVTNTGALYNDLETIRNYRIALPHPEIQSYIGNKVRLAEKCREEAWISKNRAYDNLRNLVQKPDQGQSFNNTEAFKKLLNIPYCVSITPELLTERLTAVSYNNNFLEFMALVDSSDYKFVELGDHYEISAMIGWKNLTTADYVRQGIKMLRVADISDCFVLLDNAVQVISKKVDEQPQIHLQENDIVFSKDGTLGVAAVMPKIDELVCAGSTLARLRIKTRELDPYYLCAFLNSNYAAAQISYYISGIAQPHITQEYIKQIKVPMMPISEQLKIGGEFKRYDILNRSAHNWIAEAKNDIEKLIEGKLEAEDIISGSLRCPDWNEFEKQIDRQILDHA